MLSMVNFFVGFCVGSSNVKVRSDRVIKSNQIMFVSMLQIWNLGYFRHFLIIKYRDRSFFLLTWMLRHLLIFLILLIMCFYRFYYKSESINLSFFFFKSCLKKMGLILIHFFIIADDQASLHPPRLISWESKVNGRINLR